MRRLMKRFFRKQHKGQSIVVLALGMIALLGFVGITTDISLLFVRYATLRRAVDAAAIAAAGQMRQDRSIATVNLTARSYIELHGLNPRNVWVESCQNQPRTDRDPLNPGLQNAPPAVTTARANFTNAANALSDAIAGGTIDLIALRDTYVSTANAYLNAISSAATNVPSNVQDLGTTARNLLNTFGAYATSPEISTNFTPTHNAILNYDGQLAPYLPVDWTDDSEICTADQRKLVRVTAQIESPTVFLRLFGWQNILLEASAVSETAVLDVVVVMDVSESMMFDTTIQDWEQVHMAVAYLPPLIERKDSRLQPNDTTVLGRMIVDTNTASSDLAEVIPSWVPSGTLEADWRAPDNNLAKPPVTATFPYTPPFARPAANVVNTYADTYETWVDGWFWGEYLLGVPQSEVNRRLFYLDIDQPLNGEASVGDKSATGPLAPYVAPNDPNTAYDAIRNAYYQVRSFVPDGITNPQTHPREACRVRFYPFSMISDVDPVLAEMYVDEYNLTNAQWFNIENYDNPGSTQPQWSGFVPTFNFYGCCNDPSSGRVDRDGNIVSTTGGAFVLDSNTWVNDGRFDDLVCQPMKQARDATRLFLERIDFLRGDRVGFVTFDKSAYVVDPDGQNGVAGRANLSHMIEDIETATSLLNMAIGVRAEPNYYVWNEDGGIFAGAPVGAPWSGALGGGTQYSAGYNQNNQIIPVNYDCTSAECPPPAIDNMIAAPITQAAINPAYTNYPVAGNCSIQNAELQYPYSLFATRNTGDPILDNTNNAALYRIFNPPAYGVGSQALWTSYSNTRRLATGYELTTDHSYEKQGTCRGTNIGAALREGNSALTNPKTTRRAGTVWIMILLSDGAAGASDPVRTGGNKIDQALPYEEVSRFDWRMRTGTPRSSGQYGRGISATTGALVARGGYGWLGLCPFGSPNSPDTLGRLVTNPDGKTFPFCSDPNVFSRHFCLTDGNEVGHPDFSPGFAPGSYDRDYIDRVVAAYNGDPFDPPNGIVPVGWRVFDPAIETESEYTLDQNLEKGNIFDVDIGAFGNANCNMLYDVDDYARDWADFVAGVDQEQSGDAVLPTIFTIGFRLEFEDRPHGTNNLTCEQQIGNNDSPEYDRCMCNLNIEQCLGEELLRYIADAGDNFVIDNDLHQDWRNHDGFYTLVNTNKDVTDWGPKDPCENPDVNWFDPAVTDLDWAPRRGGENCGNYYNAPSVTELQQVFDDIASRMFTRLAG